MTAPYSSRFRISTFDPLPDPDDIFNKATKKATQIQTAGAARVVEPRGNQDGIKPGWDRKQLSYGSIYAWQTGFQRTHPPFLKDYHACWQRRSEHCRHPILLNAMGEESNLTLLHSVLPVDHWG